MKKQFRDPIHLGNGAWTVPLGDFLACDTLRCTLQSHILPRIYGPNGRVGSIPDSSPYST